MIAAAVILLVAAILLFKFFSQFMAHRALFHKLPGETSYHYVYGNLHKYPGPNEAGIEYDFQMSTKTKYFHRVWAGPFTPVVLVYHPDAVRPILKSSAPKPREKLFATPYDMGVKWLGEGLLIANGALWARHRRLLTPAFHFDILKPYMHVYNQCSKLLVGKIKEVSGKSETFDLFHLVGMDALDVILRCAFSFHSDCQTKGQTDYTLALAELMHLWTIRSYKPHLFNEFIYSLSSEGRRFYKLCDIAHTMAELLINKRRKDLENEEELSKVNQRKAKDFLDILLTSKDENGVGLSPLEIRNEVDTFLFEGHDTTTSGMTWTLYCLAQYPEYQQRAYEEILEVMGDRDEVEWNDLPKLEFTTMCIKEALRLHSAVPFIERKLEEDVDIVGYKIPAGTIVAVQINILHHNPHIWDDPNDFVPERFHPDKQRFMDPFQFLPFSAGSRNCIGQNFAMNEMKVTVAQVIKNFELKVDPSNPAKRYTTATMKSETGAHVFATPRQEAF